MTDERRAAIALGPDEGRAYPMGGMRAVFKADEAETDATYPSPNDGWSHTRQGRGPIALTPMTTSSTSSKGS